MCPSDCSRAQGYTDNSGLGPILAQYLRDDADHGQILVLIANALGDHQMETYFNSTDNTGGMLCEGEKYDASAEKVFDTMEEIHHKSFRDVGGEFIKRDANEKTCAIRLPPSVFFEVLV